MATAGAVPVGNSRTDLASHLASQLPALVVVADLASHLHVAIVTGYIMFTTVKSLLFIRMHIRHMSLPTTAVVGGVDPLRFHSSPKLALA